MKDLVTIIMPCYNANSYIKEAIESVISQSFKNWELLIIDDCSYDNGMIIAENYSKQDDRIKVYKNDKNLGVSKTRNRGINLAKGNFIAFLDSDDFYIKDKLQLQINFLQNNKDVDLCATSYEIVDEKSSKIKDYLINDKCLKYNDLLKENVIGCSTVLAKSEVLKSNNFISDFKHEDFALWLYLIRKGYKLYTLSNITTKYRFSKGSRSFNKLIAALNRWEILRKSEKLSVIKAFWFLTVYLFNGIIKYK